MPEFDPDELRRQVRAVVDVEQDFRLIERIVVAHQEAGVPGAALLGALGELAAQVPDEDDHELVLNAMDLVVGW